MIHYFCVTLHFPLGEQYLTGYSGRFTQKKASGDRTLTHQPNNNETFVKREPLILTSELRSCVKVEVAVLGSRP